MVLPLPLAELERLAPEAPGAALSAPMAPRSEMEAWLALLDGRSRADVLHLLRAPLLKDRSLAQQMLRSWAGQQVIEQLGDMIEVDDRPGGAAVVQTLQDLLERQPQVTALDLLRELPSDRVRIDVDAILSLARRWRRELKRQEALITQLRRLPLAGAPPRSDRPEPTGPAGSPSAGPRAVELAVSHRRQPLPLEIWPASGGAPRRQWVLLMPGLGSRPDHFRWLSGSLASRGWPVVVLQHPGSDDLAVRQMLLGERPPPGAEVLPTRLADLQAVLAAGTDGRLALPEGDLVLMGHSLGALTAFLAAGLEPEPGLPRRCERALEDLPLTNLSSLLQCELDQVDLPLVQPPPRLAAIVAFNSFGSLLWPRGGLAPLPVPVLLSGGTLDLITPPLREQLALLAPMHSRRSRAVLVEGGSHFSVIRVEGDGDGADLFQLGEELVGVAPLAVQRALLSFTVDFLEVLPAAPSPGGGASGPAPEGRGLRPQRYRDPTVLAHVLGPAEARRVRRSLR
ncbi:alpha/beta hydrolase [Synechococcus sp. RSCCF101]|nr:alpha/beta hydrolase [Synechococcus sp. RSCCF101]